MILREIFYFDKETIEPVEDKRYSEKDDPIVDFDSTRKTRPIAQINRARLVLEVHKEEQVKDLHFVRQMYGIAANAEAGGV